MDNCQHSGEKLREGFLGQKMVVIPRDIKNKIKANPLINDLYVTDIGYYPRATHHYRERPEGAEEFIFIYCLEGHGWIKVRQSEYTLKPNNFFAIPAGVAHSYGAYKKDPWSIYWMHFTGDKAKLLYKRFLHNNSQNDEVPQVLQTPFEEQRKELFHDLILLLEHGYSMKNLEYININIWQLLTSFIYQHFYQETRHANENTNSIDTVIEYMKKHLDESMTVEELAAQLSYSASYFYTLFKEKTGYSPIHYFNHLKIQKACQYLTFTNLSIKEISYKLGFNDPFYFSRIFKKLMEVSPSKYRSIYKD